MSCWRGVIVLKELVDCWQFGIVGIECEPYQGVLFDVAQQVDDIYQCCSPEVGLSILPNY